MEIRKYNESRYRKAIEKVAPDEEYTLVSLQRSGIFWWIKDIRSVRAVVEADRSQGNLLGAKTKGTGLGLRYQISGRDIINFLEHYGPGIELITSTL